MLSKIAVLDKIRDRLRREVETEREELRELTEVLGNNIEVQELFSFLGDREKFGVMILEELRNIRWKIDRTK